MSDLMQKVVLGLVRLMLIPITTWLMQHNIITSDESVKFGAEVASWIVAVGFTVLAYIRSHRKTLTALAMPKNSTLKELDDQMKRGTASVLTGKTETPKMSAWLLPIVAAGLTASLLISCGAKTPAHLPAEIPLAINSTDAQLREGAMRATEMLSKSQDLLVEVITEEKKLEPLMSADVKAKTREVLHRINAGIIKGAQDIKTAAHTWQELSAAITPITAEVQRLVDLAQTLRQPGGFTGLAARLLDYVKSIVPKFAVIPAGARS